jgi:hypothetical protein
MPEVRERLRGLDKTQRQPWPGRLDPNDPEEQTYLRECSTSTCPKCGEIVEHDMLIVQRTSKGDELWTLGP